MTTIVFFRHGETDWNLECKFQGRNDRPLNETGIKQAKELKEKISDFNFSVALSSSLKRAIQTMDICFEDQNIEKIVSDDLVECDFGDISGMKYQDAFKKYANFFSIIDDPENPMFFKEKFPNGESKADTLIRSLTFISDFLKNKEDGIDTIAVSSHSGIIRYIKAIDGNDFRGIKNGDLLVISEEKLNELKDKILKISKQ